MEWQTRPVELDVACLQDEMLVVGGPGLPECNPAGRSSTENIRPLA
ncbi:hypothetical protein BZL30_0379 [Mycobacterium kansasii]|uniref:Uncharacterized protein n=1 Tax=Mycobacterium kansasii TaxID=1768 RepID=A0A1V3XTV3_MYCKA|nr:hypothetical protein BZL30_0379 [Mycobacterium kansasii]